MLAINRKDKNILIVLKDIYKEPIAKLMVQLKPFPLRKGIKQRVLTSTSFIQHDMEAFASAVSWRQKVKDIRAERWETE